MQSRVDGVAAFVAVAVTAGALVTLATVRSRAEQLVLAAAVVLAAFLALRVSAWLVVPNIAAVTTLVCLAASLADRGSLRQVGFVHGLRSIGRTTVALALTPRFVHTNARAAVPHGGLGRHLASAARGLAVAVPLMVLLGLLLASADAVFASVLDIGIDAGDLIGHAIVGGVAAMGAAALLVRSTARDPQPSADWRPEMGSLEANVILGGLISVYAVFAASRLMVSLRGADYVVEATGVTYAEYARSGFFQLLWAAGITLAVLLALRATVVLGSPTARRAFAGLSLVAIALTLVVVFTAISRLGLYEDAFGLTMLRLSSTIAAWWIACVFVLVGIAIVSRRFEHWLPAATLLSAVVLLGAMNVVNPEAVVVRANADRVATGARFDLDYALSLSEDSVPALVDALPRLHPADEEAATRILCARRQELPATWNRSVATAGDSLEDLCGSPDR